MGPITNADLLAAINGVVSTQKEHAVLIQGLQTAQTEQGNKIMGILLARAEEAGEKKGKTHAFHEIDRRKNAWVLPLGSIGTVVLALIGFLTYLPTLTKDTIKQALENPVTSATVTKDNIK